MKGKISLLLFIIIAFSAAIICISPERASADELSESIESGLDNLDLKEFEDFYNSVVKDGAKDFTSVLEGMLKGEYESEYDSILQYILNLFLTDVNNSLPVFLSVLAIAVLCCIVQNVKSAFFADGVGDVIFFVCILSVVLIISAEMVSIWQTAQNLIQNIAKLNDIMSPVILTLMIASGGKVSAAVYKPTVLFLTNGIINIFTYVIFPLIGVMIIFSILNCFSGSIKLGKFSEVITSLIKWIIGLSFTIYGIFLSVQGISGATFDGISVKAAKYAISNSIPLIGGYLKDGFDLVVAGSVLIKNAVGVVGVIALFYTVLSPVLHIAVVSLLLKLTSAFSEPLSNHELANLCMSFSKGASYIATAVLAVGFMLFITVLLMIFSANAFI